MKKIALVVLAASGFIFAQSSNASQTATSAEVWISAAPEVIFDSDEAPSVCTRACGRVGKQYAGDYITWRNGADPADPNVNKCLCK